MPRLSNKLVEEIQPRDKEHRVWDDKVIGFGVRVKPTGTKTYFVQYRSKAGKVCRISIGRHGTISTTNARKKAIKIQAEVLFGEDPLRKAAEEGQESTLLAGSVSG